MQTSKLDQLKIEREPEHESNPVRWPLYTVLAVSVIAVIAWWNLRPDQAVEVRTIIAREISSKTASTVLIMVLSRILAFQPTQ